MVEKRDFSFFFLDYSGKSAQMRLSVGGIASPQKRNGVFLKDVNMILCGKKNEGSPSYPAECL